MKLMMMTYDIIHKYFILMAYSKRNTLDIAFKILFKIKTVFNNKNEASYSKL